MKFEGCYTALVTPFGKDGRYRLSVRAEFQNILNRLYYTVPTGAGGTFVTNPVGRGKVISFYLTGQGFVPNAPPDGAAPTTALPTAIPPKLLSPSVTGGIVDPKYVLYSGLGAFAGGWQINFQVPDSVPPGNNNIIAVTMNDVPSNVGPTSNIIVTYAVK